MFGWFEQRINPYPEAAPTQPPATFKAFLWHYSKDAAPWLALMAVLTALIAVGEVFLFGFLGKIVDWLSTAGPEGFLAREGWRLAGMGVLVAIILPFLVFLDAVIVHQVLLGNYPMIGRWQMHRYLLRQSVSFFSNEFAGRVATKVMQTSLAVRETVIKMLDVFVYVVVFFLTMTGLIIAADWRLAVPLIVWVAVYVLLLRYFVPKLREIASVQADARSSMTGRLVDSYTNISTVKLFSHAGREEDYARDSMDIFLQTVHRQMRLVTKLNSLIYFNNSLLIFVVSALAIAFWLSGTVTVGAIAVVIGLALRINGMAQWVMWEVSALFENIGVVHDGMEMLARKHDIEDHPTSTALVAKAGAISFENVRFHYGKQRSVIENFSLEIRAGERVGLVGRSGAGKTTLINLLLRFYNLESGRILVDGEDISLVTQDSLRARIGVVSQDTSLLHRSIRENIAYGKPDATDEDIIHAAKRANAWDFIETLEDHQGRKGLDAQAGERGVKLSGGQRQRIAIARVFLKDAPILVLDEATSALDSEVEAAIQENLFALMQGKTVISIAHRLSTLTQMDRLIVLEQGRIAETGSHDELAAGNGLYADLWSRQSGGFIADDAKADPVPAQ